MFGLGLPEVLLILVIALLVFGAGRLPEIGRALGKSLGEFKKGMNEYNNPPDKDKKDENKS